MQHQPHIVCIGIGAQRVYHTLDGIQQIGFFIHQSQLSGLDLGHIQNILDDPQQRKRAVADRGENALLIGAKRGAAQNFHHADHAIHGGAYLVAHGGQKFAFGVVGHKGGFARIIQLAHIALHQKRKHRHFEGDDQKRGQQHQKRDIGG